MWPSAKCRVLASWAGLLFETLGLATGRPRGCWNEGVPSPPSAPTTCLGWGWPTGQRPPAVPGGGEALPPGADRPHHPHDGGGPPHAVHPHRARRLLGWAGVLGPLPSIPNCENGCRVNERVFGGLVAETSATKYYCIKSHELQTSKVKRGDAVPIFSAPMLSPTSSLASPSTRGGRGRRWAEEAEEVHRRCVGGDP